MQIDAILYVCVLPIELNRHFSLFFFLFSSCCAFVVFNIKCRLCITSTLKNDTNQIYYYLNIEKKTANYATQNPKIAFMNCSRFGANSVRSPIMAFVSLFRFCCRSIPVVVRLFLYCVCNSLSMSTIQRCIFTICTLHKTSISCPFTTTRLLSNRYDQKWTKQTTQTKLFLS